MSIILVVSLFILILLGVPIAISMGLSATLAVWLGGDISLIILAQQVFVSIDSFTLMAIPFFILAGTIMEFGGISQRLINLANAFTGHIQGGLGIVAVVASLFFGAISGSGTATVAALGGILIPGMIKQGYHKNFAASVQAVAGELGVIIPPSITLILYGVATNTSVGDLFMAGLLPGILVAIFLAITVFVLAKIRGYEKGERSTMAEKKYALKDSLLALILPIIILGGIYGGIFTPTEASVVAVAYALFLGVFVYKEINIKKIIPIFSTAGISSAIILFIIANAGLFGWVLSREGIFRIVSDFFLGISSNAYIFLIIINLLLLVVGMFFEASGAIIILAPILTPSAIAFGIDPIHFGIIMVVNLAIGMSTPPLGVNLFISSEIAGISLEEITKGILPFIFVLLISLSIITFVPELSLWLPNLLK